MCVHQLEDEEDTGEKCLPSGSRRAGCSMDILTAWYRDHITSTTLAQVTGHLGCMATHHINSTLPLSKVGDIRTY